MYPSIDCSKHYGLLPDVKQIPKRVMTRNELSRRYPNASESFLKQNSSDGVAPNAVAKPDPQYEPVAEKAGTGSDDCFRFVLVTSHRVRLVDERNLYDKYFIDCLVRAGLLHDDSPRFCKIQVGQIKVEDPAAERTTIEIFSKES